MRNAKMKAWYKVFAIYMSPFCIFDLLLDKIQIAKLTK